MRVVDVLQGRLNSEADGGWSRKHSALKVRLLDIAGWGFSTSPRVHRVKLKPTVIRNR